MNWLSNYSYWWWIPLLTIVYSFQAWLTYQNNNVNTKFWFWALWLSGLLQLWPLVSKYSKNLIFDGMLYDSILFLAYTFTMVYLGESKNFTVVQWSGLVIVIFGFILMHMPTK